MKLECLEVSGTPREMGRAQGEEFRSRIRVFMEMRFDAVRGYLAEWGYEGEWEHILEVGHGSFGLFEAWDPAGHAELVGIAEAADVDAEQLFTITNMTDMRDAVLLHAPNGPKFQRSDERVYHDEGCSSVLVPASRTKLRQPIVGQTWDLNPDDVEYVVAIRRRPADGPQAWSVTCTGCLSLMGHNEKGLAIGTTNLKTYGSGPGVGYLSILHRSLRCRTIEEGIRNVETAPHAGAHTYWVGAPNRQVDIEASPNGSFVRDTSEGSVWRTNHCITPEHRAVEAEVMGLSTQARFVRLRQLLSNGEQDVDSIKDIFADRTRGVLSINRYAEDDQGAATNAVFIASPSERKAWACRGPADRGEWIELSF